MKTLRKYNLYWSPEGRCIGTEWAATARAAIRLAPYPYRHYLGEIYAMEVHDRIPENIPES